LLENVVLETTEHWTIDEKEEEEEKIDLHFEIGEFASCRVRLCDAANETDLEIDFAFELQPENDDPIAPEKPEIDFAFELPRENDDPIAPENLVEQEIDFDFAFELRLANDD